MPVELRKRKAPAPPPAPPPSRKKSTKAKTADTNNQVVKKTAEKISNNKKEANGAFKPTEKPGPPAKGDTIRLDNFGGEVETNDGKTVSLKDLVKESKSGVVLFTYPKASTPGCTKQVCFFRDDYEFLTKTGLLIFGLSADSTKANTTFKTKQKLNYPLLCDPKRTLISAIGLKKAPNGTQRGVFVIDKSGKVLAAEHGNPIGTLEVVKAIVEETAGIEETIKSDGEKEAEDKEEGDAKSEEEKKEKKKEEKTEEEKTEEEKNEKKADENGESKEEKD